MKLIEHSTDMQITSVNSLGYQLHFKFQCRLLLCAYYGIEKKVRLKNVGHTQEAPSSRIKLILYIYSYFVLELDLKRHILKLLTCDLHILPSPR